jgi:VanZ family protein
MNATSSLLSRFRRWILAGLILMWAAAFTTTHLPGPSLPKMHLSDKSLHAIGFFALSVTFLLTLRAYGVTRLRRDGLVLIVMPIYGAVDELTQGLPFVGRTTDVRDWLFDIIGIAIALAVWEGIALLISRGCRKGRPASP